jgi:hypothetical protein
MKRRLMPSQDPALRHHSMQVSAHQFGRHFFIGEIKK